MFRQELGDFISIVCFKRAISGMEEALGDKATAIAMTSAGRKRGKELAQQSGWSSLTSWDVIADKLKFSLGKDGTRLCNVEKIIEEDSVIKVYTSETLCSAGEPQDSHRKCTYTLGAIWGVLEQITGRRLQGKHTDSVLSGSSYDLFEFTNFG